MSNESVARVVPTSASVDLRIEEAVPAVCPPSLEVREINELASLERFAADWNSLLPRTPGASYFQSFDWFATYWRHFGATRRMRVMLVWGNQRLVGVVPLCIVRERTKIGGVRSLRYPLDGWGSFYGPIGGEPRMLLRAALAHVLATPRDWDLIDMLWVDRDGDDQRATEYALRDLQLHVRANAWLPSAQVELQGGWEAYWSGRKSHWRTNVRRSARRLRESGELGYVRWRPLGAAQNDGDPRWDLYEQCERIAAASWQGFSATGTTLSHESVRNYLRAAHAAAAAFGAADINLLMLNGEAAAFAYNYHFAGYVFGLRAGFNQGNTTGGAGTVLTQMMIEDSCRRGDRILDLGPGSLETKRSWQTRIEAAWRYTHYSPRSPKAQALRTLHAVKSWLGS
jgi:CelD/BcsL family acetyltransferase involved in cellulose biosynthesis